MTAAWFKTAAFKANAAGQLGTSGRNILDKPGTKRVDLGLMRIFKLGERIEMPFKAEATNAFKKDSKTAKLPADDRIPVQISDITGETVVPTYPVMEYGHVPGGGDAIGAGLLYNGKAIPIRRGKYVFSDITTGRIWYADYKEMLAADDGKPETLAPIHEMKLRWNGQVYDTMAAIAEIGCRGGKNEHLLGRAPVSGAGRADARLAVDAAGEIYIYTKSDGTIRAVTGG